MENIDANWQQLFDCLGELKSLLLERGPDSVRVISRPRAIELADLSPSTWERLEAAHDTPPTVQISPNRIGYKLSDFQRWLDGRKERGK